MTTENEDAIKEGKARVFTSNNIFYNPVQEFNRDMSVAALTVFAEHFKPQISKKSLKRSADNSIPSETETDSKQEGITVLEALAATGLRSIRYALEVPNLKLIYANDCSARAVEAMNRNAKENGVEHLVKTENHDAIWLMQKFHFENKSIHAIDLDPYGCPTRFLDSAVNCIADGGLLLITCTDMAVIAGNSPETCYVKYGAISLRSPACHEMALRIALQNVGSHCGRYGRYIVPLMSFSADFYIRLFVQVFTSQKMCKETSSNMSMVYQCNGCEMATLQPLGLKIPRDNSNNYKFLLPTGPPVSNACEHCGGKFKIGGPIWSGKLHDEGFVDKMLAIAKRNELATSKRMFGMLSMIKEELPDVPLYYTVDSLCGKLHCTSISLLDFRCALLNAGYRVSSSHCKVNSMKTDAPQTFVWDVLRHWVQKYPVSEKRLKEDRVTASILEKSINSEINFAYCSDAVPSSTTSKLLRYQPNPLPHWGPGTRSKSNVFNENQAASSKQKRNQNKKKNPKTSNSELEEQQKSPVHETGLGST